MDVFTAISGRRSCRKFHPEAVSDADIEKILEAGNWAPSPANQQPWEFVVITNRGIKERIFSESEICKKKLFERSGWKWLEKFPIDFVKEAPVIIAVVGDPKKSGADLFLDEGAGRGYLEGCSAAVQNMMLAAHALGLGSSLVQPLRGRAGPADPQSRCGKGSRGTSVPRKARFFRRDEAEGLP